MSATTRAGGPVLSPEQRAAAHAGPDGAFLIAAGPGTGKTFTATERFCWLVEQNTPPDSILAVTFSDRAAEELRRRITSELGSRRPDLGPQVLDGAWIGTFHGVCARLLDEFAYLVGSPREMRVLDETAQRLFEQELIARLRSGAAAPFDPDAYAALSVEDLDDLIRSGLRFLLKLKGRGIGPERFRNRALELHARAWSGRPARANGAGNGQGGPDAGRAELEAIDVLYTVYRSYEEALHAQSLRDFDDLILQVIDALERVPEFRTRCRERFRHLLVDEFQDTNRIQLDLIRLLAADGFGNVTVVGDAKQSIYGWRDAEIENIRSRFPGRPLPLTHNRRSFQGILDCATDFIRRDADFASEPELVATRGSGGGPPVTVLMAPDSRTEARSVADTIRRLHVQGRAFRDMAILSHSVRMLPRDFEDELRRQGIPYVTSGGSGFFDRQEIKDVVALLRLTENPMDDGALVRILQGPIVRLSDAGMYRLAARRFGRSGMRLRDCFEESRLEGFPEMEAKVAAQAVQLIELTDRIGRLRDAMTVADVLNRLLEESGYLRWAELRARRDGSPRALLNLRKVFQLAGRFERDLALAGIGDFVRHLDQVIDAELPVGEATEEAAEAVSLLTIHAAKGLEFPVVFLVNLRPPRPRDTERLFFDPDSLGFVMKTWRGDKHPRYVETSPGAPAVKLAVGERRRIVYVGLTRSRDELYVTATREEATAREVGANGIDDHDHFAEILSWAFAHPESATVVESEQLELPVPRATNGRVHDDPAVVAAVLQRLERIRPAAFASGAPARISVDLSFSQLHDFELCPVRYRFAEVWNVPAPPDELQPRHVRAIGSTELGAAVHEALAAWHNTGGDLVELYSGPDAGREMLLRYLQQPLARARTLAVEAGFNMSIDGTRVRGVVDRICEIEGQTVLVDFKTNASLDAALLDAYRLQLRIYGVAARRGLLPGGSYPRLVLFDLRKGEQHEVEPDAAQVERRVKEAAGRIAAGDFRLGPEHAGRPCRLCTYRPICPDARPGS